MDQNLMNLDEAMKESLEKIFQLLDEKKYFLAKDELLKYNDADIAEMFEELLDKPELIEQTVVVYRLLPKDVSVEVFSYLPSDDQLKIVDGITDTELSYIVKELDFDDKIDILEELPANLVDKILEKTPKNERALINSYLNYPDNCAGSLMTPEYISLQKEMTVGEALAYIKREGMDAETIYTCYVKDAGRKLIGIVSLSTLVITGDEVKIKDIMHVMEEAATEDIERMNGVISFDDPDKDYLDVSVWQHAINRLPWLLILMIAYIFTGMIITNFEARLSEIICLVAYMPMLMGTGGNTGSQAATLIIRGLATGEVETSDALRILWKEIRIGFVIGVILSLFNFARICLFDRYNVMIALTVCTAMLFIVIFAKVLGSMVPLFVKKLKLDPALIANPAISSISDTVALTIYFAMASLFLGL